MKAIVCTIYRPPDVLHIEEVERPIPKEDEVLVRVYAASVNAADWHLLTADIFLVRLFNGLLKPKRTILGADIAGQVEAAGGNVRLFKPGNEVFGDVFAHGGAEVTAVCSTMNQELASSLGADHVIDYNNEDFTRNGQQYDLILAVNGYHPITAYRRALAFGGTYAMIGGKPAQMYQSMLFGPFLSIFGKKKMLVVSSKSSREHLLFLKELIEKGKLFPEYVEQLGLYGLRDPLRLRLQQLVRGWPTRTTTRAP